MGTYTQKLKKRGITLLLAIIVVSVLLSVGLNLSVLAIKELGFSRISRDAISAHYAAESALECAVYWLFQGEQYFSNTQASDIHCNDETITVGGVGVMESTVNLNTGLSQYGTVKVIKTDPDMRDYDFYSEGFNFDPVVSPEGIIVQQELSAELQEICSFDPSNVDADDTSASSITIASNNLQNTLDTAFGLTSNHIDIENNTGYQTWSLGSITSNVTIHLEVTPLESNAGNFNVFGYYLNNTGDPYDDWEDIIDEGDFHPVFTNKTHSTSASNLDNGYANASWNPELLVENPTTTKPWHSFTVSASPGDVIAFAVHSEEWNHTEEYFRTTEKYLNENGSQYVLSYNVPEPVDPELPEYVLAYEDLYLTGGPSNVDYDDMVVVLRVLSCTTNLKRN